MKSQVNELLQVTEGLFADASLAYPALRDELSKDLETLALLCQARDQTVFLLDLPNLDSLLLEGLETGRLSLKGPLSQRKSKRIQVPKLFSGLWLRVFDANANLKQDVDVTAIAFLRQFLTIGKKIVVECSDDRIQASVGAYHDIERKLRKPTLEWDSDSLGLRRSNTLDHLVDDQCGDLFSGAPSGLPGLEDNTEGIDHEYADRGTYRSLAFLGLAQGAEAFRQEEAGTCAAPLCSRAEDGHHGSDGSLVEDYVLLNQIQRVADLFVETLPDLDPIALSGEWEESGLGIGFKHGPGAVAERKKNWEKSQFPNWPAKLQAVFPYEFCGKTAGSVGSLRPHNHEVASRLLCVPKTAKSPRLIAAEPTAHQWCQQLVLRFLTDHTRGLLRGSFIDFKDQSKSGGMVLQASKDGQLATVDLSDASDRLTCWTVERMFRRSPSLLTALHAARTRYIRDEISDVASFLKLKKFASQGTAVTFPVMSLTMLFIALGSSLKGEVAWRNIWKLKNQVRVFGDDIIVPTHGYARLCRAMELLQLKVNKAKSFVNGKFRESCGVDGYLGYDVTPVKPKTLVAHDPAGCQALIDITNNLFNKGYWHASRVCEHLLPARVQRNCRIVGILSNRGSRGLASYSGGDESHLTRRWNSRLHRYEVRVWSLRDQALRRQRDGESALLDFFASKHNPAEARTVSEYADLRKTRDGLHWEPASYLDRLSNIPTGTRCRRDSERGAQSVPHLHPNLPRSRTCRAGNVRAK